MGDVQIKAEMKRSQIESQKQGKLREHAERAAKVTTRQAEKMAFKQVQAEERLDKAEQVCVDVWRGYRSSGAVQRDRLVCGRDAARVH